MFICNPILFCAKLAGPAQSFESQFGAVILNVSLLEGGADHTDGRNLMFDESNDRGWQDPN
jgi:hypothetical protein